MTLADLKIAVDEAIEDLGDDAPVQLVTQPHWPMLYHVADADPYWPENGEDDPVFLIREGGQIGYGSGDMF